jgi:hypothetical protein
MPISNPIPKNNMFATPESMEQVLQLVESIPFDNGARSSAMTAVMMALNLASDAVDKAIASSADVPGVTVAFVRDHMQMQKDELNNHRLFNTVTKEYTAWAKVNALAILDKYVSVSGYFKEQEGIYLTEDFIHIGSVK